LTREFNRDEPIALLASGQAVVFYRIAMMSKDGWSSQFEFTGDRARRVCCLPTAPSGLEERHADAQ
jgi:hypothetical protein